MHITCVLVDLDAITRRVPLRKSCNALQRETAPSQVSQAQHSATDVISELLNALQKQQRQQCIPDGLPASAPCGQHADDRLPLPDAPSGQPAAAAAPLADATPMAGPCDAAPVADPAGLVAQLESIAAGPKGKVLAPAAKKKALKKPAAALKRPAAAATNVAKSTHDVTPMKRKTSLDTPPSKPKKPKLGCSKCKYTSCSMCRRMAGLK